MRIETAVVTGAPSAETSTTDDSAGEGAGEIIVVCSPKGGAGKTVVSTNLAISLNDMGRRVCLLDLDLEFGDVGIALALDPERSLIDAVTADVPDDVDDPVALLTTPYRPGLDCILAPIDPHAVDRIPEGLVADLLALLRSSYDVVVVDTGTHLSSHVLAAIDAATALVLVARPEIPTLKNMRLFVDTLDVRGQTRATRLIVCNATDTRGVLSPDEVEHALELPIAVRVPSSADVIEALNRGCPLAASKPSHAVTRAMEELAVAALGTVAGGGTGESRHSEPARRTRRSRRLRRSSE